MAGRHCSLRVTCGRRYRVGPRGAAGRGSRAEPCSARRTAGVAPRPLPAHRAPSLPRGVGLDLAAPQAALHVGFQDFPEPSSSVETVDEGGELPAQPTPACVLVTGAGIWMQRLEAGH